VWCLDIPENQCIERHALSGFCQKIKYDTKQYAEKDYRETDGLNDQAVGMGLLQRDGGNDGSTEAVLGCTDTFLIRPTTTVDVVPPRAAPTKRLVSNDKSKIRMHITLVAIQVVINPAIVIPADSLSDDLISDIFSSVPLSKRMNNNTRLLKMGPNWPNEAGFTNPRTGPITNPISMSPRTSGMLFQSNTPLR
jgi:hypothetical protein